MPAPRPVIALNAQLLRLNAGYRSAGIAQYQYHLLRALPSAAPDLALHAFTGDPALRDRLTEIELHFSRWPTARPTLRILWEQLALPIHLARGRYDLFHALAFVSATLSRIPSVVTVYDTSFVLYPEYFHSANRTYLRLGTRRSAAHARRVIAISESTRLDLVRLFGVPAEKIDVIPPGVDAGRFDCEAGEVERLRAARGLPEHFVLYLGTLERRKNITTLIRAFTVAKARAKLPHRLVLAGGRGALDASIARVIAETGAARDVLLPGYVPDEELPYWYGSADAFVYPSEYEGFGMPVLEAMAAGTPVITANTSALPEVVGEAGLMVSPRDQDGLAEALVRVLTDRAFASELGERGRRRALGFTWEACATATATVYRQVLNSRTEGPPAAG